MNEKEVTFNVKYEIVLYTPVFNARWARYQVKVCTDHESNPDGPIGGS